MSYTHILALTIGGRTTTLLYILPVGSIKGYFLARVYLGEKKMASSLVIIAFKCATLLPVLCSLIYSRFFKKLILTY